MSGTTYSGYTVRLVNDTNGLPPHTFLLISGPNGYKQGWGFYPNAQGVPIAPGQLIDNTDHPWNAGGTPIPLTTGQYNNLLNLITKTIADPPVYNIVDGSDCTAWALQALSTAGVFPSLVNLQQSPYVPILPNLFQTIEYNPWTVAGAQDIAQFADTISANFSAMVQYGGQFIPDLMSLYSSTQTIHNGDGSYYQIGPGGNNTPTVAFFDPSAAEAVSLQDSLNPNGSNSCTINDLGGTLWTSFNALLNSSGQLEQTTQDNINGTSQITTYAASGSTATNYTGPNGTGSITKIDQENSNGTSQITTYSGGSTTTTTYSGANGTGSITQVSIKSATANIVSTTAAGILEYNYTGSTFNQFYNTYTPTNTSPFQGVKVIGSIVVNVGNQTIKPGTYLTPQAVSFTITDGITSYSGPADQNINLARGYISLNSNYAVYGWAMYAETPNYPAAGSSVVNTSTGGDSGHIEGNTSGTFLAGVTSTPGSWSQAIATTAMTVSPLAGQTQQLASLLTNPSLTKQGAVENLTINGPGTVSVSGADSISNVTNNGIVAITSGSSFDVSSTLNASSAGVFQLMTKASLEIASILGTGVKIQFLGSAPTNDLIIDSAYNFGTHAGTTSYAGPLLEGFTAGDMIDFKGIANTNLKLTYISATGDLQITSSSGSPLATLAFQNSTLGTGTFHTASDGVGGTLITHS